jgi:hypothetical protein
MFVAGAVVLSMTSGLEAGEVRGPTSVFSNSAGETVGGEVVNTINLSGLDPYVQGVSDFDNYIAIDPVHALSAGEWFAPEGTTTGTLIYDMGDVYNIHRAAFWNEEGYGIEQVTFLTALTSGGIYTAVGTFTPIDNDASMSYSAEVFDLTDSQARFIRLDLVADDTPTAFGGNTDDRYLSIGEVAFDTTVIPEPASLALIGTGLLLCATRHRAS